MKKKLLFAILSLIVLKTEAQSSVFTVVDSLLLQGKYQVALSELEKRTPKTIRLFQKIGEIYYQVGDFNKAVTQFETGMELGESTAIQMRLAKTYGILGRTKEAIGMYESIVKKDSLNLIAFNSLGNLYLSRARAKSAEKVYRYLIQQDSLNPNFQYQLGRALSDKGRKFEMVDYFLKAYELDPKHTKSMYRLAKFYKAISKKDSTRLFIDKGLQVSPNDINFLQLKANFSYTAKEYPEAIAQLKKLEKLNYRTKNIYDMFGMSYLKMEKYDSAIIYFDKALKIERGDPTISYRMAKLYHAQDSIKKATFYAMTAVMGLKPDFDKEYYLLGLLQKEQGQIRQAITSFEKSYYNNTRNHKSLYALATTSDAFYKDKKGVYKHYNSYLKRFASKDEEMTMFIKKRIQEIKEELFLEGETLGE